MSGCLCRWNMWFTYNEAMWLLAPVFFAYGLRRIWNGTRLSAFNDWTGRYPKDWANSESKIRIWVHAVSVGEVIAASSIVAALKNKFTNSWILVTTVTETGMKTAKQRIRHADAFAFLPFDITPFPRWAMERV
ncbi:MAG: hypothetical protein NZ805_15705, partial [Armatimonadetes bacterium]|nr:hypothetical protein [Armatimonadota bacterium]